MENHTAKHFSLQLGSLIALYLSISFLIVLLFGIINTLLPAETDSYWQLENYSSSIRLGVAMVVVFFPTYIILTNLVNRAREKVEGGKYLNFTKWMIYLSLLIAGGTLLVDLVIVIMSFLEGDLTSRFILKALVVLVVVGTAFYYYLMDARGYWINNRSKSKLFGLVASIVVLGAVIVGMLNVTPPAELRERELDQQQVNDLTNIQYAVIDYWRLNDELPTDLSMIENLRIPEAPEGRSSYQYEIDGNTFSLCAEFSADAPNQDYRPETPMRPDMDIDIVNQNNWNYTAGKHCFERTVITNE